MDSKEKRRLAAEAFAHALHTGETSAAARVAHFLAPDVVVTGGRQDIVGRDAVLANITGIWPTTAVYLQGGWSEPEAWGDGVVVRAEFPPLGAGPSSLTLAFTFNDQDEIVAVERSIAKSSRPESTPEIPLVVRGLIDNALYNGTPMVLAYVNEDDEPVLTIRGSTRVFGPTQISVWVRNREGNIIRAIRRNPKISLLYRDSKYRTTLTVRGRARMTLDDDVCRKVFEMSPEVEQNHDPDRTGAALIIDVIEIKGGTQMGEVLVRP